ncbi:murein L,D-transpeptidase family protein [Proteus mirabilis]|uniref:murein L,D-transpeptidase family protein n=1 Tax=Proteus mirabilis TaxID=584 RepID=UPI001A187874|nr:murein L,D-transpeptidase family protein [Proteus mirabilis]MBI6381502.1 murein L,D-transpeptidase [Proteus mirabilis]MBI6408937.1 murein L,D-transpeptidase [Proteus mirabilis]MDQ6218137.1 murein L,D-transpeptidase [Proteus mirabilis]HEK0684938.1 murein L,D-transpeptidase [Proteus mirabilis]HEK0686754.1 murein L,D-transpeptidase [Proteus mirabilis]
MTSHAKQLIIFLTIILTSLFVNAENSSKFLIKPVKKSTGEPIYIQIFKEENLLELYIEKQDGQLEKIRTYPICSYSGGLGPKKYQGDLKSPEGFYQVNQTQLTPNSRFYRAINLGFPNQYDQEQGYTGDFLMIHGACKSVGCYAMTDTVMDEIYQYAELALKNGQQSINIHIFPFKMTDENMKKFQYSANMDFWQQLAPAYQYVEEYKKIPAISVKNGRYLVNNREAISTLNLAKSIDSKWLQNSQPTIK